MSDHESFRDLLCRIGTRADGFEADVKTARDEALANLVRAEKAEARVKELEALQADWERNRDCWKALSERDGFHNLFQREAVASGDVERCRAEARRSEAFVKSMQDEREEALAKVGVADRIVTSPEFRDLIASLCRDPEHDSDAIAVLALIDREVKR